MASGKRGPKPKYLPSTPEQARALVDLVDLGVHRTYFQKLLGIDAHTFRKLLKRCREVAYREGRE